MKVKHDVSVCLGGLAVLRNDGLVESRAGVGSIRRVGVELVQVRKLLSVLCHCAILGEHRTYQSVVARHQRVEVDGDDVTSVEVTESFSVVRDIGHWLGEPAVSIVPAALGTSSQLGVKVRLLRLVERGLGAHDGLVVLDVSLGLVTLQDLAYEHNVPLGAEQSCRRRNARQ